MNADVSARRVAPPPVTGHPRPLPFFDTSSCAPLSRGSRSLYGGFYEIGVGIELYDFHADTFDWSRCFHPISLELCLNLQGHGTIRSKRSQMDFEPGTAGFYFPGKRSLLATRAAGEHHRFITVAYSGYFLEDHLASCDGALHPILESFLRGGPGTNRLGLVRPLTWGQEQAIRHLIEPLVPQGARPLWYHSQLLQLMAEFLFERCDDSELFCDQQKRLAGGRTGQVITMLSANLTNPPSLQTLSRQIGCSPLYLRRIFFNETGMTIAQYLCKLRMETAADLLRAGKMTVAEAASAVGYSNARDFTQLFCHTMGRCPALYPTNRDSVKPSSSC